MPTSPRIETRLDRTDVGIGPYIPKEVITMTVKSQNEKMGQGVGFERIRRITSYLVGTMDKWNDAKRAEERDRVKHGLNGNA